jgi:hypothetical protein
MLGNEPFYYRTIRRNVVAFGTIFKDITLVRYKKDSYSEIDRFNVPISYAGKENFLTRLLANPDLHKPTQIVLPRMSFEMTSLAYDSTRKNSSFFSTFNQVSQNNVNQQYSGVPYDLEFELNIYVRNVEDGTQIVEQILPYFNPDYTLSMSFVDQMNIKRDIPIILESVEYTPSYEGNAETTVRILVWTLKFKMKTYFFGPINTGSLIREVQANTYIYNNSSSSVIQLNLESGNGNYQINETIYQGINLPNSNITAQVVSWDNVGGVLTVTNTRGKFDPSINVIGYNTRTSRSIMTIDTPNQQIVSIVITPNPPTANLGDDFGFTEVIHETPNL